MLLNKTHEENVYCVQQALFFSSTNLVCIRYIDRLPALSDVADDSGPPRNSDLLLLFHLLQRRTGTHVEQLGHQIPGSRRVPRTWRRRQRICSGPRIWRWRIVVKFNTLTAWWLRVTWPQVVAGTSTTVIIWTPVTLYEEQRPSVRIEEYTDVLEYLVTQRPHIQFVTDVLHLQINNTDRQLAAIPDLPSTESCGPQGLQRKSSLMANLASLFNFQWY